ncbi:tetratricopeptide (TPR) repeat protein [Paraburkholderia sp. GAS41]|jgi:tetratricopeptide (TPR) repeat protein|uniref:tetratricopeptide repeat protein n=1 Tax=Paraburkholderia sp. GAS41 TaxID=3035134 RepID=UPI003D2082F9
MFNQDISPATVGATIERANAAFSARRMDEAARLYRIALAENPGNVHALHRLALACVHENALHEASAHIELALQIAPEHAELWEHAGLIAATRRDYVRAEACYQRAIHIAGSTASLHRNLADCLRQLGRLLEARDHYKRAIDLDSELHHAIRALARISDELGETDNAATCWLRAWALDSSTLKDGLDAIESLIKARRTRQLAEVIAEIRLRFANDAEALKALAFTLNTNDHVNEALSVARQGLAIDPLHPLLHHNAARSLSLCGRPSEALPHSLKAAQCLPDNPYLQFQLAGTLLSLGEFEEGWKRYAWFYAIPGKDKECVRPPFPEWKGEPLAGCTFLLVGEQGRGDEIQFIRFAEWLHEQGAIVDVLVSQPVAGVAASMKSVRTVFIAVPPGPYDYWSLMLKMPEPMKLSQSMLPIAMPYVTAAPDKLEYWKAHVNAISPRPADRATKRIGIVWAGGPHHVLNRFRSIRLDALKPLFAMSCTTWYSVQKGDRERESEALAAEFDLHTLGPAIQDFTDTLALLNTFDLLITVDTSVAHLAGAAGLPVWTLLQAGADWRWMTERNDSPWYPSMRLFRQRELGDWDTVIDEVREALQKWCETPQS